MRAVRLALFLGACDVEDPPLSIASVPDVEFEILNSDRPEALRCNPEIRLGRKVPVEVLESVSRSVLEREAKGCDFGFAAYYLPAMRPGSGAWAMAELGPEISVSILGLSLDDEQALLGRAAAQGETLGVWVDDTSYASVLSLYRDKNGLKLARWYPDDEQSREPIRVARSGQAFELRDASESRGERHYRFSPDGDLETWDGATFLSAARKVRLDVDLAALEREDAERRVLRAGAATAGRSRQRAAAAEERWRKFNDWLTVYHDGLDPARQPVLYLGALQDENERKAACAQLTAILSKVAPEARVAPSQQIDLTPLLTSLDRLGAACAGDREIKVLLEAGTANEAWRRVDRSVEQVVSELRPEEE